jgi:hypothetical protein
LEGIGIFGQEDTVNNLVGPFWSGNLQTKKNDKGSTLKDINDL